MNYIKDFIYVNKYSLSKTVESLKKNYLLVFTGIVYSIISMIASYIISIIISGPFAILSGILLYLVRSALISSYLYFLFNVIYYNRFNIKDIKQGFTYYLFNIYGVLFILYLGNILLDLLNNILGLNAYILIMIIQVLILVLFNSIPETIYQKGYSAPDTFAYSFNFIKENWLNWLITIGIFTCIIYLVSGQILTELFNINISFRFNFSLIYILRYILGQTIFTVMMLYRGHMYKLLSTSTIRKRMFMNRL
ncbi:MAG: hypothetical protein GX231_03155 [Tissierellia bacterium]|nr:hypothetical protein [Tissierellia bacterium]